MANESESEADVIGRMQEQADILLLTAFALFSLSAFI